MAADASTLAITVRDQFGSAVGIGLRTRIEPSQQGLYEGTIDVTVSGASHGSDTFPIRAAFGEIQRRAALNAADVLRRALMVLP